MTARRAGSGQRSLPHRLPSRYGIAKAEFHRAVRRLHLSGASLREVAAALQLSHQRGHQIVETAGGARRRRQLPPELACSFCRQPQRKTRKLIAGPGIYICEKCVETAGAVIRTGTAAETPLGPLQSAPAGVSRQRCGFCGKHRHQVTGLAVSTGNPAGKPLKPVGDAAICAECLNLCREIRSEQLT